jgi:hypothetical protein
MQPASTSSSCNAIWIQPYQDLLSQTPQAQQTLVQNMVDGGIKYVFIACGNWHQSNAGVASISNWIPTATWQQLITIFKTYSNNQLQVHAWMYFSGPPVGEPNLVNLASPTIRQQCVDAAVNYVQTYNLDGFNDDLVESYAGSDMDYVAFANALGTAMRDIGKVSSVDLVSPWSSEMYDPAGYEPVYSGITEIDYICVMLYGPLELGSWNEANLNYNLDLALAAAGTDVLAGIMVSRTGEGRTCGEILEGMGHPTHSKFAGVAIYNLIYMQSDDWIALLNWA